MGKYIDKHNRTPQNHTLMMPIRADGAYSNISAAGLASNTIWSNVILH